MGVRLLERWRRHDGDPEIGLVLAILCASCVLVVLFAAATWQTRSAAFDEAEARARNMAALFQSYVQNTLDSFEQTIERVDDNLVGLSDRDIRRSVDLRRLLQRATADRPQVGSILIVSGDGNIVATSGEQPSREVNVGDRDYMRAFRAGHKGTYVGGLVHGRVTGREMFTIARARFNSAGEFAGVIVMAAAPEEVARAWGASSRHTDASLALVREDGAVLMRQSTGEDANTSLPTEAFLASPAQRLAGVWNAPRGADGSSHIIGFRKLDRYPIFALYAFNTADVTALWVRRVLMYGVFAVPAAGLLALLSFVALRKAADERAALARLESEIAARKLTEAQLLESHKMESLGQLTGGIAHDFNNLLTVLLGNADLLGRADRDRQKKLVQTMGGVIERARQLTSQLLAFARRQPLVPEPTDLNALVSGMRDLIAQSLREDIELVLELAPDLWTTRVDPAQLRVALINIAANARDAMPGGGRFEIRTINGCGHDATDESSVSIIASDTGVGMSPEVMGRAFEPFFSSKGVGQGTGLGLSQVYGFVSQSGGTAKLTSTPGRGTTIILSFPRCEEQPQRPTLSAVRKEGPLHILVVEDDDAVAAMATELLVDEGHRVERVAKATEAVAKVEIDGAFDLVFSDVIMPGGMDGVALARHLREVAPETAIVLTTGYIDVTRRQEAREFVLLHKPYSREGLTHAILEATGNANMQVNGNVITLQKA